MTSIKTSIKRKVIDSKRDILMKEVQPLLEVAVRIKLCGNVLCLGRWFEPSDISNQESLT